MTENKRYSFNWERGHPNFWDNYCDLADCYLTCEDVVDLLNELAEENKALKKQLQTEHTMLDNAILLERTRMGKNCLKQFRDAIQ